MKTDDKKSEKLQEMAKSFMLDIVYVFGSQAKAVAGWLFSPTSEILVPAVSDVDVGVKPTPTKRLSVKEKVKLAAALEDLFSVDRVDLVVLPEADPFLAANVIRGERLWANDEYLADEYELYVLRRAGDFASLERERMALVLGEDG